MNFLYKIYSRYDGFRPRIIPTRLIDENNIPLGWKRYLDEVEIGDYVWVYFYGHDDYEPGVYIKGRVIKKNADAEKEVVLRVVDFNTSTSLTDDESSRKISEIVKTKGRQVFLFPTDWPVSECDVFSQAESCTQRRCEWCPTWQSFTRIEDIDINIPTKLSIEEVTFIASYWAIPPRCYFKYGSIREDIHLVTRLIKAFKLGNQNLAYPFARGIYETIINEKSIDVNFDCIVPIPLSPDKAKKGEIHRTRLIAQILSKLLKIPVKPLLSLSKPISKRRMLAQGYTYGQFEAAYYQALEVEDFESLEHVLLIDDVCTYGGTLRVAIQKLKMNSTELSITAAVAAQMIVKSVVPSTSVIY